jgi:hypothetical protein
LGENTVSNAIVRLLERRTLRDAVQRAMASGIGLYRTIWDFGGGGADDLAAEVLAWCRESLSRMHRPYGVDSVSFAFSMVGSGGRQLASGHLAILRPGDFYGAGVGAGVVEVEIRGILERWTRDRLLAQEGARLSVVLFSWGDLTRELLLAA